MNATGINITRRELLRLLCGDTGSKATVVLLIVLLVFRFAAVSATDAALFGRLSAMEELIEAASPFNGKININAKDSTPDWPRSTKAPKGAPNIVVILLDDIGFGDTSAFGGVVQTPELDKLAAEGLRYNNFHTTGMCSPTRAALLAGRNHHRVGFGIIGDLAGGYPGYNSIWKKSTVSIAEVLRHHGYSTSAFGKWHNTPDWEITPTGPFDRWPTGLGFEYFYGFMGPGGAENQWEPSKLYRNTVPVDPPATPAQGYHFTVDMTDEAIRWLQAHDSLAPEKPYFLYFSPGAVHSPHHAPTEWIEKYRGKFDHGWDWVNTEVFARQKQLGVIPTNAQLTPRPKEIPAWALLSADQKKLYARQMEVYAGFIAHTDYEIGRLLTTVRSGAAGENTLILYIVGDNGSAAGDVDGISSRGSTLQEQLQHMDELGSPRVAFNHYSGGWAWAGSTPFQYWKTIASHFGGVRTPLVVSWPAHIKDKGGMRSQFTHVNDVAATLYDVIGVALPSRVNGVDQQPLDGVSFAQTFGNSAVPSAHRTQYFEIFGNRSIYHDGWVAATRHQLPKGSFSWGTFSWSDADYTRDRWELYHVAEDFSESRDLANAYPDKLRELQALFDVEARKNDVYPLGAASIVGQPSLTTGKRAFVYYPGTRRIPSALVPKFSQITYRILADVTVPENGAQGVIASFGDRDNGFTWYVKQGHLIYENKAGANHQVITSRALLPKGDVALAFEFVRDNAEPKHWWEVSSGIGRLYVNGQISGETRLQVQMRGDPALYIGQVVGSPVSDAFSPPFEFDGTLKQVRVEVQLQDLGAASSATREGSVARRSQCLPPRQLEC